MKVSTKSEQDHKAESSSAEISLIMNRVPTYVFLLFSLLSVSCTPSQDEASEAETESQVEYPGADEMAPEEVATIREGGFATIQYAIKAAACAELAFKFDVDLSERLFAASFDAHVRYFENQRKPLWGTNDSNWAINGSRERAALAVGRVLGSTDVRLTQGVREQGGGDVIAAAREKYRSDGCPAQ